MRLEAIADVRPLKPGRTADPLRPELPGPKATSKCEPMKRSEIDRGQWPETKGDFDHGRRVGYASESDRERPTAEAWSNRRSPSTGTSRPESDIQVRADEMIQT